MKLKLLVVLVVSCLIQQSHGMGMLKYKIGVLPEQTISAPFSGTALTDQVTDGTTMRFNLTDDFSTKWSFRTKHAQTDSENINNDTYDVKPGVDLYFRFQMFSKTSPWAVKYMLVQGADVKDVKFDYNQETIDVTVQPTIAAKTANHTMADYGGLSIDFYYNNKSEDLDYGVPVIITDAYLDDADRLSDSTPSGFKGTGFNLDGMSGERVNFNVLLGERFVMHHGLQFNQIMGYVDGMMPATGFQFSGPSDPGFTADLGESTETFKIYVGYNLNFSKRDIQIGVFPAPLAITSSSKEVDGFHIMWSNENGKTYTIESTDNLSVNFTEKATGQSGPDYIDTSANSGSRFYRIKEE